MPLTTVTTTGVMITDRNSMRKAIYFENISPAQNIRLQNCAATAIQYATADVHLAPGAWKVFNTAGGAIDQVVDQWSAIADGGSNTLIWKEFFGTGEAIMAGGSTGQGGSVNSQNRVYDGTNWQNMAGSATGVADQFIFDRNFYTDVVGRDLPLASGQTLTTSGIDISGVSAATILVETDGNCTAYYQLSDDDVSYYDMKTEADGDISNICNNESIAVAVRGVAQYLRVVVVNNSGAARLVTVVLQSLV